jgi:MYXO-CTERM domain-containing protein
MDELDGTSMASPHVAGIAALMIDSGIRSPGEVRDRLIDTASNPNNDPLLGAGLVQADRAVRSGFGLTDTVVLVVAAIGLVLALFWRRRRTR